MLRLSRCFVVAGVIVTMARPIRADEAQAATPTLTITNERVCPGAISPYQYGQFIEYLCALTPSMFAEKVFDGSFEGVPALRVCVSQERPTAIEQPWYPDGAVNRGEFALDPTRPLQRQSLTAHPPEAGRSLHARHFAERHVRQSGRTAAAVAATCERSDAQVRSKATLWGEGKVYAAAEF